MAMKKGIVIAVVLACALIVSASAIIANQYLQASSSPSTSTPTPSASPQPVEAVPSSLSNLYDAELTYVHVGPTTSTGEGHDHFGFGVETYPSNYYPVTIVFNLTYLGNPANEPFDEKFEGYLVTLSADTGVTASYIGWFGTNLNQSCSSLPSGGFTGGSPSGPPQHVSFKFNLTLNQSFLSSLSDAGSYGSSPGSLGLWSNGAPNGITVTVQKTGWVTIDGESTSTLTNPANDVVLQQVQLEKAGDDFIFGSQPPL